MRKAILILLNLMTVAMMIPALSSDTPPADPWPKSELLEPAALAKVLSSTGQQPIVISVAFPVLYRQRHILHAKFAGPGGKPEGIQALRELVANAPKNSEVVIYCGCCPMEKCPNVRPAYRALKELGFTRIRVLSLPTNFHTDWSEKGFPVE